MATTYWKARDTDGVVHVVAQDPAYDDSAAPECTFYCSGNVWWHIGVYAQIPRNTDITCLCCLAEVDPALLRLMG